MIAYASTTRDITVTVRPIYLDEQSDFIEKRFAFGYSVVIQNESDDEIQLLRRHWTIRESNGQSKDVEGKGVVGEQPVIAPGATHHYNSSCVLTSFGATMEGTYLMQRENGERFRATIPQFPLHAAAN